MENRDIAEVGARLNHNELVVYNNDAIRPSYLVMYGIPKRESELSARRTVEKVRYQKLFPCIVRQDGAYRYPYRQTVYQLQAR